MSRQPSFRDLATMYAGPSSLSEAIASASFDHIEGAAGVRETLRAWTDTDEEFRPLALLGLSITELLGAFFQIGVVYLLTRPEVIAEFEATRKKADE